MTSWGQLAFVVAVVGMLGLVGLEWSQASGTTPGTGPRGRAKTVLTGAGARRDPRGVAELESKRGEAIEAGAVAVAQGITRTPGTHAWSRKLFTRGDIEGLFGSTDGSKREHAHALAAFAFFPSLDTPNGFKYVSTVTVASYVGF